VRRFAGGKRVPPRGRGGGGEPRGGGKRGLSRFSLVIGRVHNLWLGLGRVGCADLDLARLHDLRKLADEFDGQQSVRELGAGDANVIGEAEVTFEAALGNA
jgi:hypothetical protein